MQRYRNYPTITFFAYITTLLLFTFSLSSCVSIIDATTEGPIEQDPSKRTFGAYIDDKEIETIVAVNIKKAHPDLDQSNINVSSFNGVVLLTGQISRKELRDLAGQTAQQVNKVRQVYNELQLQSKISFLAHLNDGWLRTKVRTRLAFNKEINSKKVKVVTESGVVYLMGLLTRSQAEKITEVARTTGGVQKVVRAIEYVEG